MAINSLYRGYFQKSLVFLYPALGIKRGGSVTPIKTYMAWSGKYKPEDRRLVCLYHIRNDADYLAFEKSMLTGNRLFESIEILQEGDKAVYVFNFDQFPEDWDRVLTGKYSKLSGDLKQKIGHFYGKNSSSYAYVNSFLYPDKYYGIYADLLNVDVKILRQTGELCEHPNLEKETLVATPKDLHISKIIT